MEILTSQNVNLITEKAGVGDRFLAILIDMLVIGAISILSIILVNGSKSEQYIFVFNSILFLGYNFFFELFGKGRSIGKHILNTRVVSVDSEKLSFIQLFIRNILRPVDYLFGLGLVFMIFNSKSQRIGDLAAGTYVIKLRKIDREEVAFTDLEEEYNPLLDRYQLEKISPKTIELIKEVINDSKKKLRYEAVKQLYLKITSIMEIEQSDLTHIQFLEIVVKDYNYYQL